MKISVFIEVKNQIEFHIKFLISDIFALNSENEEIV